MTIYNGKTIDDLKNITDDQIVLLIDIKQLLQDIKELLTGQI